MDIHKGCAEEWDRGEDGGDLENAVATFIIGGEKLIQHSDILSQRNR
jgi:hypothetical protein